MESGGFNGEAMSNTLYMERYLNWTGILIEPDNITFPQLLSKKRKSWALPVCLSLEPYPTQVMRRKSYEIKCFFFYKLYVNYAQVTFNNTITGIGTVVVKGDNKKITDTGPNPFTIPFSEKKSERIFSVQCFPLYSILLAVNRTVIDFISLDVEGHEFRILKTVPWHKIDVKVFIIIVLHVRLNYETSSYFYLI